MLTEQSIKAMFSNRMFERGKRYYRKGAVERVVFDELLKSWSGTVLGSEMYRVSIRKHDDDTFEKNCSCPAYDTFGECKHIVAVMFKIANREAVDKGQPFDDFLEKHKQYDMPTRRINNEPKLTEDLSARIINLFMDTHSVDSTLYKEPLQTEYILKIEHQLFKGLLLSVEMKTGVDRTYVVKNLKKFLKSVDEQSEHFFTSKFSYDPKLHMFKEEDQRVMQILLDIYRSDAFYENQWQPTANQKGLTIPPYFAKQLLTALSERGCTFEDVTGNFQEIHLLEDALPFDFSLHESNQGYELGFDAMDHFHYFKNYDIIQEGQYFYHLNANQREIMNNIYGFMVRNPKSSIPINAHQMDAFVSNVIPNLKKIGDVTLSENVSNAIINPSLQATIHLDQEEERLTANVRYLYDDIEIDPMQPDGAYKQDSSKILVRETEKEQRVMNVIEEAGFKFNGQELYLDDEEDTFTFLYYLLPRLEEDVAIYLTNTVKNLLVDEIESPTVHVDLDSNGDFLEIDFDLGDIDQSEISQLIQSVVEKKRYYRLPNGRFVPLDEDSFAQISTVFDEMRLNPDDLKDGKIHVPAYRGLQMDEAMSQHFRKNYNQAFQQLIEDIKNPETFDVPLPDGIHADLREYQIFGFQWLKSLSRYRFGGILADDMGLGKTLQTIAYLLSEKENNPEQDQPALVVSPASLVYNWESEFEKFAPSMKVCVIHGSIGDREMLFKYAHEYDVLITSYPLVRQDLEQYRERRFSTLILDEAQAIKNHLTKQAQAIRAIRAGRRFALSGTPIENSLDELWSLFDVIMPGFFPSKKAFRELPQEQISRMSRPFILRRIKQDVLTELPDKIETVNHSELTKDQKQLYLGYLEKIQGEAASAISSDGFQKSRMKILAGLTRLRQLCCHPSLFIEGYEGESGKLNQLLEMVETARQNGQRILIFSQFSSMLKIIREEMNAMGEDVFYLDGQTPSKHRVDMVNRFNDGEKNIFLISLKAGGTGLNLTGADTVILYDLWWNPAVEEQATGRAHRMGQKKVVQVYRLITKGTIEEKIHALQQRKKELIENVIQPGETNFTSLSENEIRELLNV
uniref:DEAD/DEAH box helicase n=1 Tax=uncultured Allobacillus sp. TaxID=1638025 RepID=UPI002592C62F|nr:DEAD/DEAH box helicase [uncultured Allobacillus sp.]